MISAETRQALTETAEALDDALKRVYLIDAAQRRVEGRPESSGVTGRDVLRTLHKDMPLDQRMEQLKAFMGDVLEDPDLNEIRRGLETALFFVRDILEKGE